jgi:hypothetical protein
MASDAGPKTATQSDIFNGGVLFGPITINFTVLLQAKRVTEIVKVTYCERVENRGYDFITRRFQCKEH